jgi:hypothetical protein
MSSPLKYRFHYKFMKAYEKIDHLDDLVKKKIKDFGIYSLEGNYILSTGEINRAYDIYKVMRAFQSFMCLIHEPNYILILHNNPNFVSQFFGLVATVFSQGISGCLNLIIKLIEYFVLKNPVEAVKCIVSHNIISFFVSYVSFPKYKLVRHLLTCLIDPSDKYLGIPRDLKILIWKHCKNACRLPD